MIYRSLLSIAKCINKNIAYYFAYWWTSAYCHINHFALANSSLPSCPVDVMNLRFPNPVGLAAGFDRDGRLAEKLHAVGFGFIEIGTVNVDSENDSDNKLMNIARNSQAFNNHSTCQPLHGISLGSLRSSIDDKTINDYIQGMKNYWHYADYFVINLSRPESAMRSEKKNKVELSNLLTKIKAEHTELCLEHKNHIPVIIKVAIDYETRNTLPEPLTIACALNYDGLLIAFENWPSNDEIISTVGKISTLTNKLPLIVVGGIRTADDVLCLTNAGASLVQCYSYFWENGPHEMKKMIRKVTLLAKV